MMSFNVRAIRLALTNLILFFLTWYYQVPERAWALITVWFVMFDYTYVGGVWTKSMYRFLGTFLSSVYGLSIIYFYYNNVVIDILAFIPAIFLYVYFFMDTDKSYIGTIGCVTLSIVLLNHNDIDAAILRTFNIFLGIVASLFMMRFFYPEYARDSLMDLQIQCVETFETVFNALSGKSLSSETIKNIEKTNETNLNQTLTEFSARLKEAKIETVDVPQFVAHHEKTLDIIRHISRLMGMLIQVLAIEDTRPDEYFQNTIKQCLKQLEMMKALLTAKENMQISVSSSFDHASHSNRQEMEEYPFSTTQQKFVFLLVESIQKEIGEWRDEMIQIISLYQLNFKPKSMALRGT